MALVSTVNRGNYFQLTGVANVQLACQLEVTLALKSKLTLALLWPSDESSVML